jgi:hypothetical protein
MPIEMALWRLNGDVPTPVGSSSLDTERRLEDILEKDISILGLDRLIVIGRQVPTTWGANLLTCLHWIRKATCTSSS